MIDLQERIKKQILELVSVRPEVRKVLVFGSRARGDADERSDIDLAVEAPNATQRQWLDLSFELKELDTLLRVDVVRLEEATSTLKARILAEGEILYEQG